MEYITDLAALQITALLQVEKTVKLCQWIHPGDGMPEVLIQGYAESTIANLLLNIDGCKKKKDKVGYAFLIIQD